MLQDELEAVKRKEGHLSSQVALLQADRSSGQDALKMKDVTMAQVEQTLQGTLIAND